jgi:hypothetical protein
LRSRPFSVAELLRRMNFGGARSAQHDNKNGQFEIFNKNMGVI